MLWKRLSIAKNPIVQLKPAPYAGAGGRTRSGGEREKERRHQQNPNWLQPAGIVIGTMI